MGKESKLIETQWRENWKGLFLALLKNPSGEEEEEEEEKEEKKQEKWMRQKSFTGEKEEEEPEVRTGFFDLWF